MKSPTKIDRRPETGERFSFIVVRRAHENSFEVRVTAGDGRHFGKFSDGRKNDLRVKNKPSSKLEDEGHVSRCCE